MSKQATDKRYMRMALRLAKKGCGFVNPNPMVGCVIVKDGMVIGRGYHKCFGGAHAEPDALGNCRESPNGATLYVTLEPCRHHGKTPPCTDAIIQSGVARVVIGCLDPNPLMSGKSAELLCESGIEVTAGVIERECAELNKVFFHFITTKTPFVVMKYAMTADGKIATKTGESRWITGETARRRVHKDRQRYSAVMVGVGTVISDDPLLTCRVENGRNPIRVVCDTKLRTPLDSQLAVTARDIPTIIVTACTDRDRHKHYADKGFEVVTVPELNGRIDLKELMYTLGGRGVDSILLEGGGTLNWSALESRIVNRVQTYIAPKVFGGSAPSPVGGTGVETPDRAFQLANSSVTVLDGDVLIESEVDYGVHRDN